MKILSDKTRNVLVNVLYQGRSHCEGGGGSYGPPISISEPNKVRKFQFKTSGILLFTDVQNNLWRFFISSNYTGEIVHFTLDLLLWKVHFLKTTKNEDLNRRL